MIRAKLKASNMPTCPPLFLFIGSTPSLAVKKKKRLLETMLSLSHNPNSLLVFLLLCNIYYWMVGNAP